MPLQQDILVIALAFAIAASLYVVSFRDLMAVPPAPVGVARGLF